MKETNSERTIKDRCERSYGNIGKIIALRALFRCLSVNAKKKNSGTTCEKLVVKS